MKAIRVPIKKALKTCAWCGTTVPKNTPVFGFSETQKPRSFGPGHRQRLCRITAQSISVSIGCSRNHYRKDILMSRFRKLSQVLWHCQYHLIWTPKYRYRILEGAVGQEVHSCLEIFCGQKGCEVIELNVQRDHIHLLVMVPPKVSISELIGVNSGCQVRIFSGLKSRTIMDDKDYSEVTIFSFPGRLVPSDSAIWDIKVSGLTCPAGVLPFNR